MGWAGWALALILFVRAFSVAAFLVVGCYATDVFLKVRKLRPTPEFDYWHDFHLSQGIYGITVTSPSLFVDQHCS